jgi:hypothetical protein
MRLASRPFFAFSNAVRQEVSRLRPLSARTARACRCFPRRAAGLLWPYASLRLEFHQGGPASASNRAEVLSYVFFILLVGATFLL